MSKWICVKNITMFPCRVEPNDIIYVEKKQFDRDYYWRIKDDGYYFSHKIYDNGYCSGFNMSETNFREFFIEISELREQQMKSILDD